MEKKNNTVELKITKAARYGISRFEKTKNGKKALVTELIDIVPKTQKVQDILEVVMENKDNPIIYLGFEDHIIGYEISTYALIYEANGIINQIADENKKCDEENGDLDSEWEDYYDDAAEMVFNNQLICVSLITGRNEQADPDEKNEPILMSSI